MNLSTMFSLVTEGTASKHYKGPAVQRGYVDPDKPKRIRPPAIVGTSKKCVDCERVKALDKFPKRFVGATAPADHDSRCTPCKVKYNSDIRTRRRMLDPRSQQQFSSSDMRAFLRLAIGRDKARRRVVAAEMGMEYNYLGKITGGSKRIPSKLADYFGFVRINNIRGEDVFFRKVLDKPA